MVWSAECRRTLRSARVLALLALYSLFSVLVLLMVGGITRALREQLDMQVGADASAASQLTEEFSKGFLGFLVGGDQTVMEALAQVPLVVVVVFKATLFFLPLYVAIMGFDQVSGEVGPRSIRYLTVRARRLSLLVGRFLSQATVLLGLVLIIDAGIFVYAWLTTPEFTLGSFAFNLLKFWLAAVVFSLSYLALTTLCSSLFRAPALSLVVNIFVLFGFWLVNLIGGFAAKDSPVAYVRYLSPSHYANGLLHPRLAEFAVSGMAYVFFTVLFLGGAIVILRERDL
ncbi:ABC transporter permease [Archangium violaceum]|uniref:ABC transporter permease n=1 Tax=Archangium violaceum TaxID=83451 RepID=UPI0036DF2B90